MTPKPLFKDLSNKFAGQILRMSKKRKERKAALHHCGDAGTNTTTNATHTIIVDDDPSVIWLDYSFAGNLAANHTSHKHADKHQQLDRQSY
jgi:hypothetical protein